MIMMGMRLMRTKLNNMSGGHFDYAQYRINDIAVEIDEVIESNDDQTPNEWGEKKGNEYPPAIIEKFKEAAHTLRQAEEMAQRVDWLLSGDDGEDSFLRRWDEEVRGYWMNAIAQTPPTAVDLPRLVRQSYFGTVRITIGCMDRMCQVTYYNDKREKQDIRGTSQEVADHINSLPNTPAQEGESLS
jgi:hypothetical protein